MIRINLLASRSRAAANLSRYVERLNLEPGHTADLRTIQPVICGDCGPSTDRHRLEIAGRDACPRCGGPAEPLRNLTLRNRGGEAA